MKNDVENKYLNVSRQIVCVFVVGGKKYLEFVLWENYLFGISLVMFFIMFYSFCYGQRWDFVRDSVLFKLKLME